MTSSPLTCFSCLFGLLFFAPFLVPVIIIVIVLAMIGKKSAYFRMQFPPVGAGENDRAADFARSTFGETRTNAAPGEVQEVKVLSTKLFGPASTQYEEVSQQNTDDSERSSSRDAQTPVHCPYCHFGMGTKMERCPKCGKSLE